MPRRAHTKTCSEALLGGGCGALADHLHGPKIVHKLDPWHLNRAIKTAFPEPGDAAPLFDLLSAGRIDELLKVLRLRLDTGFGDEGKTRGLIGYIRSTLASGDVLPVPVREQAFRAKDRKRREAILEKRRYGFGYEMVSSDGKGYEPPAGHLMPFSTHQVSRAMFNPMN